MRLPFSTPKLEHLDLYLRQKRYDRAVASIDQALRHRADDLSLMRRRAEVLGMARQHREAVDAWRDLARAYTRHGLHTRAVEVLKRLVHGAPQREDLGAELAQLIAVGSPDSQLDQSWSEVTEDAPAQQKERATSTLFTLFSAEVLAQLMERTERRSFLGGDIIVTEGESGGGMFLLVEGQVKVFTRDAEGHHIPLTELGPGDLFGEVSVLTGAARTATITAQGAVTALEVSRAAIVDLAGQYPEVLDVMQRFCEQRAQHTIETLLGRGQRR